MTGLRAVVNPLIEMKNKHPVRYAQSSGFVKSFLPAPKNIPPANNDKNIPCNTFAYINSGFLIVFRKFLFNKAPYTADLRV